MIASIYSKNYNTRLGIESHLRSLNFSQVHSFSHQQDLIQFVTQSKPEPDIIIFDLADVNDFSSQIFPKQSSLLLLIDEAPGSLKSKYPILSKPFGLPKLTDAIQASMCRTAANRDHLLIIGDSKPNFLESAARVESHWKELIFCNSSDLLKKFLDDHHEKIGGILVTEKIDQNITNLLWRLKRSPIGIDSVLAAWLENSEDIFPIRSSIDIAWINKPHTTHRYNSVLTRLSSLSTQMKKNRLVLMRTDRAIEKNSLRAAEKSLISAFKACPVDSRILQQLGALNIFKGKDSTAKKYLSQSIKYNPCRPAPYFLIKNIMGTHSSFDEYFDLAKIFCPDYLTETNHEK